MTFGTFLTVWLICGGVAAVIGQKKNFNVAHSFALGAVLGVIGVFIVAVQRANLPKPPPGMRALRCPRCNAVQNIPEGQPTFECWQCKQASSVTKPDGPEDAREWLNRNKEH
jgi:phage FluMu protein Com